MNSYRRRKNRNVLLDLISELSVVTWLIVVTSLISVISIILFAINPSYVSYLALKPVNILQGMYLWTLITHIFVHGGLVHLLINMFVLFSLGRLSERIIGSKRFFWFYIISGVFAGLLSVLLAGYFGYGFLESVFGSPDIFMVGASGAIFAIAGLYVILLPKLRFSIIFFPFFSLPGYVMIPFVLFAVWIASVFGDLPIGNVAHFGGFLAGIAYGIYLRTKYKKKVAMLQRMFR